MGVSSDYREWILEQLRAAGPVTGRVMFGGYGLYLDGLFFALIDDDVLYFKVDDSTRPEYEEAGSGPFNPMGTPMQYYEVPADVLEDRSRLLQWTEKALDVARSTKRRR